MSWRRLRVLIEYLPPESATWTALRNELPDEELARQAEKGEPEKGRWSQTEQLLAAISDRLASFQYVYSCSHIESKAKWPTPPEPMRRPGAKPKKAKPKLLGNRADELFQLINGGAA
ncbi:hypothetical protein AB0I27_22500 [Streptomyces sp. NPDC050597]|uniref:hypothetical protein n=1 Tax=Streptomyces sp. NPDC050597 TaxID=3157212 RepID=UPI003416F61A